MSHNNIGGLKMPQLIDRGSMSPPKDNSLPKLPRANQKRYSDHTEMNQAYEDRHQNGKRICSDPGVRFYLSLSYQAQTRTLARTEAAETTSTLLAT